MIDRELTIVRFRRFHGGSVFTYSLDIFFKGFNFTKSESKANPNLINGPLGNSTFAVNHFCQCRWTNIEGLREGTQRVARIVPASLNEFFLKANPEVFGFDNGGFHAPLYKTGMCFVEDFLEQTVPRRPEHIRFTYVLNGDLKSGKSEGKVHVLFSKSPAVNPKSTIMRKTKAELVNFRCSKMCWNSLCQMLFCLQLLCFMLCQNKSFFWRIYEITSTSFTSGNGTCSCSVR